MDAKDPIVLDPSGNILHDPQAAAREREEIPHQRPTFRVIQVNGIAARLVLAAALALFLFMGLGIAALAAAVMILALTLRALRKFFSGR